jgi:hypothetical protein
MLGSESTYFDQPIEVLIECRDKVFRLLELKGYGVDEITIYLKAFDYFIYNPKDFDGATIVKDLQDLPNLDLDAMLHDYHYIIYNVAANFVIKWKADWVFAKGNERKGKGQYSAFGRFVGLTITGIGFVPYAFAKRGKISIQQKTDFLKEYQILIK